MTRGILVDPLSPVSFGDTFFEYDTENNFFHKNRNFFTCTNLFQAMPRRKGDCFLCGKTSDKRCEKCNLVNCKEGSLFMTSRQT